MAPPLSHAKRRVLDLVKRLGPVGAIELSERLDVSDVAVRQHLASLESAGLVRQTVGEPSGRGRPAARWSLTSLAAELFPDRHADLTVGLLEATRAALGERGLQRVMKERGMLQLAQYRAVLPGRSASLRKRVEALARQRSAEGYMAEVRSERGVHYLIEHHCPICEAARSCQRLCAIELDVFRSYLGDEVTVERVTHLLSDGDRCVYRITKS